MTRREHPGRRSARQEERKKLRMPYSYLTNCSGHLAPGATAPNGDRLTTNEPCTRARHRVSSRRSRERRHVHRRACMHLLPPAAVIGGMQIAGAARYSYRVPCPANRGRGRTSPRSVGRSVPQPAPRLTGNVRRRTRDSSLIHDDSRGVELTACVLGRGFTDPHMTLFLALTRSSRLII